MKVNKNTPEKISVKITRSNGWYKKGEVHKVGNYLTFGFIGNDAHFEKSSGMHGIALSDCEIVHPMTTAELEKIVGHPFTIID